MTVENLTIKWCDSSDDLRAVARFFADNITDSYISHSELQGKRALDVGKWTPNIFEVFLAEIEERARSKVTTVAIGEPSVAVLAAYGGDHIAGIAYVTFEPKAPVPYAILEDIVVDRTHRGVGVGKKILAWVTAEAVRVGCSRLFLESGLQNESAHHFFEQAGFEQCSIVMMKRLV